MVAWTVLDYQSRCAVLCSEVAACLLPHMQVLCLVGGMEMVLAGVTAMVADAGTRGRASELLR